MEGIHTMAEGIIQRVMGATIKTEEVVHIEVDIIKTLILRIPMVDIRAQQPPYIGGVNRFIKKDSIY